MKDAVIEWLTAPVPFWTIYVAIFVTTMATRAWADIKAWREKRRAKR